jgi:spermidine synthase
LQFILTLVYLIFFLSGAAALMYEVVWVRSLSLIFGGTHLAVTTVLSVFMGGLALGSFFIGKRVDAVKNPLRLYGLLEIGIALSAVIFMVLMKIYPAIYILLVQGKENAALYLAFIRVLFAFGALIGPTTLMGGTLPLLTRFVSSRPEKLGGRLSFLYGFNTLGAVVGTVAAGFWLLRFYSVSTTLYIAILINSLIGILSIVIAPKASIVPERLTGEPNDADLNSIGQSSDRAAAPGELEVRFPFRIVFLGIGISGFCALGYEVLWTRILTLTIGTSVYGFTIMLAAFLTGIAFGSQTYGLLQKMLPSKTLGTKNQIIGFGLVQCIIGVCALLVTFYVRDLPVNSINLYKFYMGRGIEVFAARQWANLTLAFSYMVVPAFFMGLAFPIAGSVNAVYRKKAGHAVGNVLAANTIGAILGSAVSGYFLIYIFGIERSLQLLTVLNIGLGLLVMLSIRNIKLLNRGVVALTAAVLALLIFRPNFMRMWDAEFFAIFQNNLPEAYDTPEKKRDAVENTDVLYYREGVDSTISSIKIKGGDQALLVNGKVVASSAAQDRQCQLTLGHLPMLLHKNPRKILVIGLGTGMTLGAVSVHPNLEELTLVEIEPSVIGAARTFEKFNNYVLDNPKLQIVFNDGRNFLTTTKNKYDVITADPIHPWTQGSGYLYTAEYFNLASRHLLPGGIMCQWLPIYELSVADLKSVARTFSRSFRYTMAWMTQYDAELIGSNEPIIINEAELERRIARPSISKDLDPVMMGTATDFLSYFVMGSEAITAFSRDGIINTDDNLYLEFSTPVSVGKDVMQTNANAVAQYQEDILPYLLPAWDDAAREHQRKKWRAATEAAVIADRARALFLGGHYDSLEFRQALATLDNKYPWFAPGRFLKQQYEAELSKVPSLLQNLSFILLNEKGEPIRLVISAVIVRISKVRAAAIFVDNAARVIYGQRYFSGNDVDKTLAGFVSGVMAAIRTLYERETQIAVSRGRKFPAADPTKKKIKSVIIEKIQTTGDS